MNDTISLEDLIFVGLETIPNDGKIVCLNGHKIVGEVFWATDGGYGYCEDCASALVKSLKLSEKLSKNEDIIHPLQKPVRQEFRGRPRRPR